VANGDRGLLLSQCLFPSSLSYVQLACGYPISLLCLVQVQLLRLGEKNITETRTTIKPANDIQPQSMRIPILINRGHFSTMSRIFLFTMPDMALSTSADLHSLPWRCSRAWIFPLTAKLFVPPASRVYIADQMFLKTELHEMSY